MAKRAQSRIIPYAITGDYQFWSRNLQIKFGDPLDVTALTVEEANTLLYNTIKELLVRSNLVQRIKAYDRLWYVGHTDTYPITALHAKLQKGICTGSDLTVQMGISFFSSKIIITDVI